MRFILCVKIAIGVGVVGIAANSTMALLLSAFDCNDGATATLQGGDDELECTGDCDPNDPCELVTADIGGETYSWCDCEVWDPDDPLEIGCTPMLLHEVGQDDQAKCNGPSSCSNDPCTRSPVPLTGEFYCFCPEPN